MSANQNKNCPWRPFFLFTDRDKMINLYRRHSTDASYQVAVHLANRFYRFLEIGQPQTRIAMTAMDRNDTSNLHREPSIDASYQVSVHLA